MCMRLARVVSDARLWMSPQSLTAACAPGKPKVEDKTSTDGAARDHARGLSPNPQSVPIRERGGEKYTS